LLVLFGFVFIGIIKQFAVQRYESEFNIPNIFRKTSCHLTLVTHHLMLSNTVVGDSCVLNADFITGFIRML